MDGRKKALARRKPGKPLRVAVCIGTRDQWGRERLLGFLQYAQKRNWQTYRIQQDNKSVLVRDALLSFDGAIVFDCLNQRFQKMLKARSAVCVEIDSQNLHLADAAVFLDDAMIVRAEAGHLRSAGFEHLGFCGFANNPTSDTRVAHFVEQTNGAGHVFKDTWLDGPVDITPLMRWLKALPKPAGVLASDDRLGERVLEACRWAGIRVPDEVGVIGAGNDELICEMTQPRLSSVVLPTRKIGWMGAEMLERLMAGKKVKEKWLSLAPLDIISRTSTDRLPAARPAVLKALEFMRAESPHPIGVAQVAAAAGVSRRTLERMFSADVGRTVHDSLVQLRLQGAKQLLRQTDMPLGDIPVQSGYLSQSAFVQMFAVQTGMSPGEYRDQHRQHYRG
jgi:LacI family transcriptional regulator